MASPAPCSSYRTAWHCCCRARPLRPPSPWANGVADGRGDTSVTFVHQLNFPSCLFPLPSLHEARPGQDIPATNSGQPPSGASFARSRTDDGGQQRRRQSTCRSPGCSSDPAPAGAPRCHGVACGVSCNDALTNTESFFKSPLSRTCIASRPRRREERQTGSASALEAARRGRRRR